jgi:Asp-tRNA(Asn)/Glu-tRNA(Gln) amidotransferase C subunit
MDFLFHKLSEKDKEDIKKQVDDILKSFSVKLSKIDGKIGESFIERDKFERTEGGKQEDGNHQRVLHNSCNPTGSCFSRELMFKNAPDKNRDFIIAERKKW